MEVTDSFFLCVSVSHNSAKVETGLGGEHSFKQRFSIYSRQHLKKCHFGDLSYNT